jgi:hypothetical protein
MPVQTWRDGDGRQKHQAIHMEDREKWQINFGMEEVLH